MALIVFAFLLLVRLTFCALLRGDAAKPSCARIFFPGLRFHATAHIDRVRSRRRGSLRRHFPASNRQPEKFLPYRSRAPRHVPIECFARSAAQLAHRNHRARMPRPRLNVPAAEPKRFAHANRFNHREDALQARDRFPAIRLRATANSRVRPLAQFPAFSLLFRSRKLPPPQFPSASGARCAALSRA